jgi:Transcriptional regulators
MRRKNPTSQRLSIVDIAKRAKVSPSTVSRVFNNPELVQPSTRDAVLKVAHELGYRPNASARTLRTQRSQVLGIVLPTLDNPVFAECLQGIIGATVKHGYAIMPVTSQYEVAAEIEAVEQLLAFGVDGVVLAVSDAATSQALRRLQAHALPYVLIYNRHGEHPCVSVDGARAMHEIVQKLAAHGHQRIAMICGQLSTSDRAQQRYNGFLDAMASAGLPPAPLIEIPFVDTAIQDISAVLRRPDRPTALVCSNDLIAIRAVRAAHESGLRIPDDVSVTGFDGIGLGEDLTPRLTTVLQPNAYMGITAAEWVMSGIQNEQMPHPDDSVTLAYEVRWSESCSYAPSLPGLTALRV